MYAYIPLIWKDMVLSLAGPETWANILLEAGISSEIEEPLLNKKTRREDLIFALFGATCKKMALSRDDLLRAFGRHFVSFTLRSGNGTFLRSQGCTLPVFLENVNGMHNYMKRDHPDAKFPFIESKYVPVADTLLLTYLSIREGVSPLQASSRRSAPTSMASSSPSCPRPCRPNWPRTQRQAARRRGR